MVANARGRIVRNFSLGYAALNHDPAWSPDGRQIAFAAGWYGGWIVVADADGSNKRQLDATGGGYTTVGSSPSWSPDGRKILYTEVPWAGMIVPDVYVIDAGRAEPPARRPGRRAARLLARRLADRLRRRGHELPTEHRRQHRRRKRRRNRPARHNQHPGRPPPRLVARRKATRVRPAPERPLHNRGREHRRQRCAHRRQLAVVPSGRPNLASADVAAEHEATHLRGVARGSVSTCGGLHGSPPLPPCRCLV